MVCFLHFSSSYIQVRVIIKVAVFLRFYGMSIFMLSYILIFYLYLVNGKGLEFCHIATNKTKLCKKYGDYRPNQVPKPWPTMVTPYVDLKSVIDVDEN